MRRFSKITDEQIKAAFGGADFGSDDFPAIVADGILQVSAGFRTGGTLFGIMIHLGLVTRKNRTTKLGRLFAFDYYAADWHGIARAGAAKPAVKLPQCYEIADNIVMSGGTVLTPKRDGRLLMTADVIAMVKLAGIDIQPLPEGPRS